MADDSLIGKVAYEYPYYEDLVEPRGVLKVCRESHACFYYGILATKARQIAGKIDSQIIEYKVGEQPPEWHESRDLELARSVALIYGLENPGLFLLYRKEAWLQASLLGINIPKEVFDVSPGKKKWIH